MFRESYKNSLLSCLDYDVFRFEDFKIMMDDEAKMTIRYDEYCFSIVTNRYKKKRENN